MHVQNAKPASIEQVSAISGCILDYVEKKFSLGYAPRYLCVIYNCIFLSLLKEAFGNGPV